MLDKRYRLSDRIRRKWLRLVFASMAVTGAILFLWIFMFSKSSNTPTGPMAPDFTLPTADGSFTLSDHKGDVVVLFYSMPG